MRTLIAIFFLGLVMPAEADPIPLPPELRAFVTRPEQQKAVTTVMGQQWRTIFESCPAPKLQSMNVFISIPPKFDPSGSPISGQWRAVAHIEGCGEAHVFSVQYLFTPDGQMKLIALLPGTTIADFRLQHDALMYAAMGMAKLAPKDCKDTKYVDTKFIGFADKNSIADTNRRPWTEEWTVRSCGVTGIVTMHFAPDATGANISTTLNETRPANP